MDLTTAGSTTLLLTWAMRAALVPSGRSLRNIELITDHPVFPGWGMSVIAEQINTSEIILIFIL